MTRMNRLSKLPVARVNSRLSCTQTKVIWPIHYTSKVSFKNIILYLFLYWDVGFYEFLYMSNSISIRLVVAAATVVMVAVVVMLVVVVVVVVVVVMVLFVMVVVIVVSNSILTPF